MDTPEFSEYVSNRLYCLLFELVEVLPEDHYSNMKYEFILDHYGEKYPRLKDVNHLPLAKYDLSDLHLEGWTPGRMRFFGKRTLFFTKKAVKAIQYILQQRVEKDLISLIPTMKENKISKKQINALKRRLFEL